MLNELYKLKNSLESCGIKVKQMHDWIKCAAKMEGLQVFVGKRGIKSVEYIDKKDMSNFWKIAPNNQNNFPIFKLDVPIYK